MLKRAAEKAVHIALVLILGPRRESAQDELLRQPGERALAGVDKEVPQQQAAAAILSRIVGIRGGSRGQIAT